MTGGLSIEGIVQGVVYASRESEGSGVQYTWCVSHLVLLLPTKLTSTLFPHFASESAQDLLRTLQLSRRLIRDVASGTHFPVPLIQGNKKTVKPRRMEARAQA